ncbi:MAG: UbiD family decarboxylase [Gammaproteobacteria bacterium]|jgi:4-hydroxy-3-polyprenylbenzoate decarboxylase|nr:UbiD family decarboxylase [Gammaproteobacteria bacterium]
MRDKPGSILQWLERRQQSWQDLRAFLVDLESRGELRRVTAEVDSNLEITALCRHSLRQGGPALWFENVSGYAMPVLGNLYGTTSRIARALGLDSAQELREIGRLLTFFKSPSPPDDWRAAMQDAPQWLRLASVRPRLVQDAPCREVVMAGPDVDLAGLPVQTCWPGDAGPLLTFGLVITRGTRQPRLNVAVYRQQLIDRNRLIMRWLPHRGGAQDFRDWTRKFPDRPFPVAVVLGADPATTLAAVAPVPDTLSEFQFAGLLRGTRTELVNCECHDLQVPANAEIVLEGHIHPGDTAAEGPFCDHTGYYNAVDEFPVLTVEQVSMRAGAFYHTSFMGRPPDDEPSILAMALNEIFVPLLQTQFPEIVDFYLPPAGCSYRIALVSIRKQYPGHARRIMLGVWSWLRQFTYTKYVVVTDEDIDIRDTNQVLWAISTRADPVRDILVIEHTPIDYLDFASPVNSLGGKLGLDATSKWPGETNRDWGVVAHMPAEVERRVEEIWRDLHLHDKPE